MFVFLTVLSSRSLYTFYWDLSKGEITLRPLGNSHPKMASRRRVGLSGILFLSFIQSISTQCPEPIYSVHNHHLGDHVMSTSVVMDLSDCRKKCSKEFYCKSINYRLLNKSCDLNSADRYSHPPDYGPREGYVYMDTANRRRRKVT